MDREQPVEAPGPSTGSGQAFSLGDGACPLTTGFSPVM
jgi:hypothetical protein